jgi:hypothetical protein
MPLSNGPLIFLGSTSEKVAAHSFIDSKTSITNLAHFLTNCTWRI